MPTPSQAPLKYAVGIDIAKDNFVACFGFVDVSLQLQFGKQATFANTPTGFVSFLSWVDKQYSFGVTLLFVVEATGVYYEELAYFLTDEERTLSVLLPNKVKHFARSTEQKSKTDQLDAKLLTRLGLERALPTWEAPSDTLRTMRLLERERQALKQDNVRLTSRLHAYEHCHKPDSRILARLAERQQLIEQQIKDIDDNLVQLLEDDPGLKVKMTLLTSIPGIGMTTAIILVAETNGFSLTKNERQLASYAGLDVVHRQSGLTSKPSSISRRGNARLRTALYLPALTSLRCNPALKIFYEGLKTRKENGKIGLIAVMRKLLLMCYAIWKKDQPFDASYHSSKIISAII